VMNGAAPLLGVGEPVPVNRPRMLLPRRLYLHPPTRDAYVARLFELLDLVWIEGRILNEIDRIEYLIVSAAGDISVPLAERREFVRTRRDDFEAAYAGGPPAWAEAPFLARCIDVDGTFSASCSSSYGSLASLSGTGTLQITHQGTPLAHDVEVCGAGPDEGGAGLDTLRFVGLESDGDINVLNTIMNPAFFSPGVVPFGETLPALVVIPTSGPLVPIGLTVDGSVTFSQAGTNAGDPIEATASGQILDWVVVEVP
jgi:hypothetical protein